MASYEVRYEGWERRYDNRDAFGVLLRLWRDGSPVNPVHVVLSGPEVLGMAREVGPTVDDGQARVLQAMALEVSQWLERQLTDGVQWTDGLVLGTEPEPARVRTAAKSDQGLPGLVENKPVHAFEA